MISENVISLSDKAVQGLRHDPAIWISEGTSCYATDWKNRQTHWSVLLARLEKPTRTQETQAEYLKMTISQQGRVKDVGGFVGGTLTGGRRKGETVKDRSLITYDLDQAPQGFVDDMTLNMPYAWAIYSTHKHTPEKPRLRLILPMSRSLSPEEYEAATRKLAEEIGLEYMDSTTFQPSRLMYWPSCSRDGEYIFEYNDDELIDPDKILKEYPDWRDVSYWPVCPDEVRVQKKRAERQQDPAAKKGPIGVFCRTYTVPAAIDKFLSEVYKATDKADRYTYIRGTTFGGLVIYDDGLFCFSNHSTDPAHGQDLNAFDLVRLHLYGSMDEGTQEGTQTTKLPSYKAMMELISKDKGCIKTYDAERKAEIADVFAGETEASDPDAWMRKLTRNKQLEVEPTVQNLDAIFSNDVNLKGIKQNDLTGTAVITEPVPWKDELTEWKGTDDSCLYVYLTDKYTAFKRQDIIDVMTSTALRRRYNPIKQYLGSIAEWDGQPRVETLFIDYLGAEDSIYTREAAKRWLLAAVSRVYKPGCKFDYIPIVSGPTGIGKSTLAAKLGGEWFSDALGLDDMRDKTAAEKLLGNWVIEIPELRGMRKTDIESIKSFLSRQSDRYRPSYGRNVEEHPRTCVCIGTSNSDDYLRDITGNRRFWPIKVSGESRLKPWNMTADDVAQIWAETAFLYDCIGERSLILPKEAEKIAGEQQILALESDERSGIVGEYLDKKLPENWPSMDLSSRRFWLDGSDTEGTVARTEVSIMEIWSECFRKQPAEKKRTDSDDISRILIQLGWCRDGVRRQPIYGVQRIFSPKICK